MGAGAGKDMLLQIETAVAGTFATLGGLRSTGKTQSAEAIDITSIDSAQYKELLDGAGTKSIAVSGSGVLKDDAPAPLVQDAFDNQTLTKFRVTTVRGTIECYFKVTSFEETGEYNGAQTYSISLESSGAPTEI